MRVCISGGKRVLIGPRARHRYRAESRPSPPALSASHLFAGTACSPKITHLLNEFPSVFSLATLSLRPGTPPFNWSASWPLPSTSSFCSRTNPRCSLEGCKVVKPLSAGQEGQAVCLSAEVCLCAGDLIYWSQCEKIRWTNKSI